MARFHEGYVAVMEALGGAGQSAVSSWKDQNAVLPLPGSLTMTMEHLDDGRFEGELGLR